MNRLAEGYEGCTAGYRVQLQGTLARQANTGRMINNWAVLKTVYQMLREFMREYSVDERLPDWQDTILETIRAVQAERVGHVFLDRLTQLVASGRGMLAADLQHPEEARSGVTIIGYIDGEHILLLPDIAVQEVTRGGAMRFGTNEIAKQLREDGWLIPGANSLTVQRRVRGIQTRFWLLKADFLTCDSCDSVTA